MHFGEIALLTGNKRSASMQTKNYSTIGKMTKMHFDEMCTTNNDLRRRLYRNMRIYQDRYKTWQKL
jgi:CRP-like cAMP-binding protein